MISEMDLINTTSNASQSNQTVIANIENFNWHSLFQVIIDHPLAIFFVFLGLIILIQMNLFVSIIGTVYLATLRYFSSRKEEHMDMDKENNYRSCETGNVIDAEFMVIDREIDDKK